MLHKLGMAILIGMLAAGCFFLTVGECVALNTQKTSYLDWKPVLTAEDVFKNSILFTYVQVSKKGDVFWVEQRPNEEGRSVLVQRDAKGVIRDLTPKSYSVRTRVYEYGGFPYTVKGQWVYFTNFSDQRIYRLNLLHPSDIIPLTPEKNADGSLGKYMDLTVSPDGNWLVFVYEKEVIEGEYPDFLGVLDLRDHAIKEPTILVQGANFYKSPKFSPDGARLAWLEWNHPYMPWDSTHLYLAGFKEGKIVNDTKIQVAGSDSSSISSITFQPNGALYYAQDFAGKEESDPRNYYNIYRYNQGKITTVTQQLGDYPSLTSAGKKLLTIFEYHGEPKLILLNPETGKSQALAANYDDFTFPASSESGAIYVAAYSVSYPSQLLEITPEQTVQVIKQSTNTVVDPETVSHPILIEFPTADGKKSYGYYYPPVNPNYEPLLTEKPPVRVLVHGGPTTRTSNAFTLSKLFWTSQGMAIFDVNYRGSTGFGRQYRDALKTQWGLLEIQDVKDGLAELERRGLISGKAVVSGGSAGGYTVQRLLTYYPDLFAAGASYFGIGDLLTLQKLVHKYESHYLEQLIGGTPETNLEQYKDRSPINHLDQLKAPMILFQGSDDKVVPPENSRQVANLLKAKGIYYEYYEYKGEAHGFRKKENLKGSLEKESQFFKKVLSDK